MTIKMVYPGLLEMVSIWGFWSIMLVICISLFIRSADMTRSINKVTWVEINLCLKLTLNRMQILTSFMPFGIREFMSMRMTFQDHSLKIAGIKLEKYLRRAGLNTQQTPWWTSSTSPRNNGQLRATSLPLTSFIRLKKILCHPMSMWKEDSKSSTSNWPRVAIDLL